MDRLTLQLDESLRGATKLRRHRIQRTLIMLALVPCLVMAVVLAGVGYAAGSVRSSAGKKAQTTASQKKQSSAPKKNKNADAKKDAPAAAEVSDPKPDEPVTVDLMMVGDLLLHEGVIYSGDQGDGTFNYDHLFTHIADDVAAADIAVLNQETILGGSNWPYTGYPVFNSPQELGDAEAKVGFDVILKATNHTLDLGYDGVRTELAYWRDNHPEMSIIGMADPDSEDHVCPGGTTSVAGPYIYEKDGLRIALLNYTNVLNGNVDESYDGNVVSVWDDDKIIADIASAHEQADIVVVFPHWGPEYQTTESDHQRWGAQFLYDAGADVVIGGHPHVIQPVEVWGGEGERKMLCMFSVGNYVAHMYNAYRQVGGMAKVRFVKDADGARVADYEFVPIVCQLEPNTPNLTGYKLSDYTDELAATSIISSIDGGNGATAGWYQDFCAGVLGDSFDWETMSVHGSLS